MGLGIENLPKEAVKSVANINAPLGDVIKASRDAEKQLVKKLGEEYAAARAPKVEEKVSADELAKAYMAAHGIPLK